MSNRTNKLGDGRTNTQTDAGNDNSWRRKLASGKNKTLTYALERISNVIIECCVVEKRLHISDLFVIAFKQSSADSRLASSQWETSFQSNTVSHWLGANLETALQAMISSSYAQPYVLWWKSATVLSYPDGSHFDTHCHECAPFMSIFRCY